MPSLQGSRDVAQALAQAQQAAQAVRESAQAAAQQHYAQNPGPAAPPPAATKGG